ncbi:D-serine ammonia-lyase [Desulfosporosinus orientis DSM 765]|uniref:Probable D-serine dehydratase n=1 Tax=Desulfosporosinus orientis (strain ATCC 19365 / DSM 765 / NCIMB 8382 / VKM B-1628 / Singapore I) TaxID=768706 RepID=G7WDP4_DESOD|nr:D-serine ammonia-lyase [Desulfosporosinus orientis]AET68369.1 D-serine ammonia-lyase [Desulfosporosinus orientis DSM 765]
MVLGKSLERWRREFPLLEELIATEEVFWLNPLYRRFNDAITEIPLSLKDVEDAEERLDKFAPYIAKVFPETKESKGIIESPIVSVSNLKKQMEDMLNQPLICKDLLLKCDSHLPISGSIKARGGIYEVLKHAEDLALKAGLLAGDEDYSIFAEDNFRDFFSGYSIAVGSTGNLGLSIGIMSAKLGFKVTVHMSADAKTWKKDLLRSKGVRVIEYPSDYSKAVEEGRKQAAKDPKGYFVDDENSVNLFLGYAVAALRLKDQLKDLNISVDENHPLFVYLPCGVGGGPGGVAFGLKLIFKDHVHCFFAEPTHSPCMLLGCMTGEHDQVCVQDFGIDNITEADGLAVGRASGFVGKMMANLLSGIYTVQDKTLFKMLKAMADTEGIFIEPSALAGVPGVYNLLSSKVGEQYLMAQGLRDQIQNSSHIIWATGGNMVPESEMKSYYQKAEYYQ